jgi:hypothetical protein
MLYVAAAFYAVIFWCVTLQRPGVALALVLALAPFQNDLSGGGPVKFSIAEINLLLALPVMFLRAPRLFIGPVIVPVVLYFAVCAVSSALHWRETTLVCMVQMALYLFGAVAVFASLPREAADFKFALNGFVCVGVFLALVVTIMRSNFVLGLHKNGVGASLSCAFLVALEMWFAAETGTRRRLLAGALAVIGAGLLMSLSRGAWLGALCGVAVLLTLRRQIALFMRAALVLLPVIVIAWNLLPKESRENATGFERGRNNIEARYESIEIARGFFERDRLLGAGVGLRKEYDATSLVWLTLAETGVFGLGALALIHVAFLRMVWRAQKIVEREDELFSLLALGAALVVSRLAHGLVDHYWSRGAIMLAWAAAGMATYAFWEVRRRLAEGYDDEQDEEDEAEAQLESV